MWIRRRRREEENICPPSVNAGWREKIDWHWISLTAFKGFGNSIQDGFNRTLDDLRGSIFCQSTVSKVYPGKDVYKRNTPAFQPFGNYCVNSNAPITKWICTIKGMKKYVQFKNTSFWYFMYLILIIFISNMHPSKAHVRENFASVVSLNLKKYSISTKKEYFYARLFILPTGRQAH